MRNFMLFTVGVLALTACGTGRGPTPKTGVLTLEAGLAGADQLALNYVRMPRCTGSNAPLCSDQKIVDQIKAYSASAYSAVTAAQAAVDADPAGAATNTQAAVTDATAALAAFRAAIPAPTTTATGK